MSLLLLSRDDLRALTGLKRPDAIGRWLRSQGIPHIVAPDAWPRVHAAVVEALLGLMGTPAAAASTGRKREPRLRPG